MKPGATGKFPQGKASPDDEGELTIGIAVDHQQQLIQLDFGKPVKWLGLDKRAALGLAAAIAQKAAQLD